MNTLAEFKRDLKIGDKIELIEFSENNNFNQLNTIEIPEKLKGIREVTAINTVYFKLNASYCEFPKASNFEYNKEQGLFKIIERDTQGDIWQIRIYKFIK